MGLPVLRDAVQKKMLEALRWQLCRSWMRANSFRISFQAVCGESDDCDGAGRPGAAAFDCR